MKILKIVVLIIVALIVVGGGVFAWIYFQDEPGSMTFNLKRTEIIPVTTYNDITEGRCGIWYKDSNGEKAENSEIQKCMEQAYANCEIKGVLYADESNDAELMYSLLRVIGSDEQGNCIIQNMKYTERGDKEPLFWVNTCKDMEIESYDSCELK